jgi:DNA-binding transcriptional MerR regulator
MGARELADRFGVSLWTIQTWRKRRIIPPPYGKNKGAWYGRAHIEAIEAYRALQHNNVTAREAVDYCHETGQTLPQYLKIREASIRTFGIGVG